MSVTGRPSGQAGGTRVGLQLSIHFKFVHQYIDSVIFNEILLLCDRLAVRVPDHGIAPLEDRQGADRIEGPEQGRQPLVGTIEEATRRLYLDDRSCPLGYEPSGQDFLSPCLAEADLVRRVLSQREFGEWLGAFLPGIPTTGEVSWLPVAVVTDRADGKLAHLDGLNLSRAWMLEGIASGLPEGDRRRTALLAAARIHTEAALPHVSGEEYAGGHWLGSFATYLVTGRGLTGRAEQPDATGAVNRGGS